MKTWQNSSVGVPPGPTTRGYSLELEKDLYDLTLLSLLLLAPGSTAGAQDSWLARLPALRSPSVATWELSWAIDVARM